MKKNSLKRYELPINRFVRVALPLYLDMLDKHHQKIAELRESKQWEKMRIETMNANRTVQQLLAAVDEMETVRCQLDTWDQEEFDRHLSPHKKKALEAVRKFENNRATLFEIEGTEPGRGDRDPVETELIQEQILPEEIDLERRKAQFETWKNLQKDVEDLHDMFDELSRNVQSQGVAVDSVEQNVEAAAEQVEQGERYLAKAARYKAAMYPVTGAVIGTFIGGPVGLIAGLKIGTAAALSGTVLGFFGGKALKSAQERKQEDSLTRSQSVECCQSSDLPTDNSMKKAPSFS